MRLKLMMFCQRTQKFSSINDFTDCFLLSLAWWFDWWMVESSSKLDAYLLGLNKNYLLHCDLSIYYFQVALEIFDSTQTGNQTIAFLFLLFFLFIERRKNISWIKMAYNSQSKASINGFHCINWTFIFNSLISSVVSFLFHLVRWLSFFFAFPLFFYYYFRRSTVYCPRCT